MPTGIFTKVMLKVHQYALMCAPTTSQFAAIEAMRNGDEDIEMMRREYNYRRRLIVDGFNEIGLSCFEPEGLSTASLYSVHGNVL